MKKLSDVWLCDKCKKPLTYLEFEDGEIEGLCNNCAKLLDNKK